jgi:chromate transporter
MIPMLEREAITKRGWVTHQDLLDYYAIGQATPGIIAVDVSCFIGQRLCGIPGAIIAPLAVISPGVILMILAGLFLPKAAALPPVAHALAGIRVAACAMIVVNVTRIIKGSLKEWWTWLLCAAAFTCVAVLKLNPVWVVAGAALLAAAVFVGKRIEKSRK